jgi:hypothetical protein
MNNDKEEPLYESNPKEDDPEHPRYIVSRQVFKPKPKVEKEEKPANGNPNS